MYAHSIKEPNVYNNFKSTTTDNCFFYIYIRIKKIVKINNSIVFLMSDYYQRDLIDSRIFISLGIPMGLYLKC